MSYQIGSIKLGWLNVCPLSREKVPPRPQGQRAEPTTNNPFSGNEGMLCCEFSMNNVALGFGFGGGQPGGFHMSFGIGRRKYMHQFLLNIHNAISSEYILYL